MNGATKLPMLGEYINNTCYNKFEFVIKYLIVNLHLHINLNTAHNRSSEAEKIVAHVLAHVL